MVEVAYYIGQGRKLVLLLNDISLSEDQEVEGMKVIQGSPLHLALVYHLDNSLLPW